MGSTINIFMFAALFCKVQPQACGYSGRVPPMATQIVSPPLMATQTVIAPPAVSTTIVDNSISHALANALQLLIVSDLIESSEGLRNLISPVQEFIQPCAAPIVETLQPSFGGYTETFAPLYGPAVQITEKFQPNIGGAEKFSYNPIIEKIQPNIFGGVTETFSPLYSNSIVEKIQPAFGGNTETISTLYPPKIIEQFVPNSYGFTETVGNPFCGSKERNPPRYERISEVIPQFLQNYRGITGVMTPPMAAEVMIPSSIPAQLTCNFGYNLPSGTPAVSVNVEALPFEPCGCSKCKNYYY